MRTRRVISAALATLLGSGCVVSNNPYYSRYPLSAGQRAQVAQAARVKAAPPAPAKEWKAATGKASRKDGFLPIWQRKDGAIAIELNSLQLEQEFGLLASVSRGVSDVGIADGQPLSETMLVRFQRMGDRVLLIARESFMVAPAETGWATGIQQNRGESVIAALPIVVEDDEEGRLLVDATAFLISDFGGLSKQLASAYEGKEPALDRDRSRIVQIHGFPRNTEIDTTLTFASNVDPPYGFYGVADARSLSLGVRLSFFALPEQPMKPRLADDRVGYFNTIFFDPSRARQPWFAYVDRWRLEKKHPEQAKSEPVRPIIFYLDPSIPDEWRPYIKAGIESWNAAFEEAGFVHAVIAREELPADYSAEDIRYSTIRWVPSFGGAWGVGPSQTDPRTGEILNADIMIGGNVLRSGDILNTQLLMPTPAPAPGAHSCAMAETASRGLVGAELLLAATGRPVPKELVGDVLKMLAAHEVGHTLGLRHNFKSSSTIPYDKLQDREFTAQNGVANSVMDYWEVNLSPDPRKQGTLVQQGVGPYDRWVIKYGYTPFASDKESAGLARLLDDASAPQNAFQTDEDARLGPYAVDPGTGTWDLGDDPIRYARDRVALIDAAIPALDKIALDEGDSYYELRRAFAFLMYLRAGALDGTIRLVGGSSVARVHKGQKGEQPTFTPVGADRQRAAVKNVIEVAFAPGAWPLPAELLAKLAPWRGGARGNGARVSQVDYPAHTIVLGLQTSVLVQLLHPARLARMVDGTLLVPAGKAFTVGELIGLLSEGIWSELLGATPRDVDTIRANLQLTYLDVLAALLLPPGANPTPPIAVPIAPWDGPAPEAPVPAEARAAARAELERIAARVDVALRNKKLPAHARAHLGEAKARIARTLNASKTLVLK